MESADTALAEVGILSADWRAWLEKARQEVEDALTIHAQELKSAIGPHSRLAEAVLYSVQAGGKRLRPILVLETCRVCGGASTAAMPAALAMELMHTFSLIHDDLPAMDDDDLRRGQPSNHKAYGEAMAVLAGDWLSAHSFSLLATVPKGAECVAGLLRAFGDGVKAMIDGQAADVESEGLPADRDRVRYIHEHKTAALIETCCHLGALCGGASTGVVAALARYGRHLGLAFQIVDDLLDFRGREERLGKRVGKDAVANKQTYPAAFGETESEAQARLEVEAALHALESFGGRADRLRGLARYIISRDH